MITYRQWIEALTILGKYDEGGLDVPLQISAEHDTVYLGPASEDMSEEDIARLEELGFLDNGEDGWQVFV